MQYVYGLRESFCNPDRFSFKESENFLYTHKIKLPRHDNQKIFLWFDSQMNLNKYI